ncbi:DUF1223 domain-containing protein [Microvirga lenta]|uniref:DUF1223 domain-containing protein n=1 Tax=Microvirga lenta TaxID=2881337 RepID=UPI001CFECE48|nr:DUF1223 domain-containing protein [Microvirga lenta]MCB5174599.1 DUF1223 domain-containing protein [Microvirga lenta]
MFHGGIMVSRLKLISAALFLAAFMQPAQAEPPRAVVELFTSQGCSSCPPADAVLVELAREPDVVALSFPVNYWDYLGWKDTLAHKAFTERQKAYAHARGDRQVYTPQMIVNGTKPCIGSNRAQVEESIKEVTASQPNLPLDVTIKEQNGVAKIAVSETAMADMRAADVWVLPVLRTRTVPIERGENRGRSVTYANVVRGLKRIGEWRGGSAEFEVPLEVARSGADGYVVLLQTSEHMKPGVILGAAKSPGLY